MSSSSREAALEDKRRIFAEELRARPDVIINQHDGSFIEVRDGIGYLVDPNSLESLDRPDLHPGLAAIYELFRQQIHRPLRSVNGGGRSIDIHFKAEAGGFFSSIRIRVADDGAIVIEKA